jgi:bifunctional non-homologous end joining protein LigD
MSVRVSNPSAAVGFVAPCLPSLAGRPPKGTGWIHEIKHDGFRMMVRRNGVGVRTRNGYDWTDRYQLIRQAGHALRASSFLIDGEAVNCNENGLPDFKTLRYRKNDTTVFLYAFDLIELDGRDLRREAIEVRESALARLLRKADYGIFLNEHVEDEGAIVFQHACRLGLEGIVSKRRGSPYLSGRSTHWLKLKNPNSDAVRRETEEEWDCYVVRNVAVQSHFSKN